MANPFAIFSNLWRYRYLTWQLARREVTGRYRGSWMGLAWSLMTPLFALGIYTFVFHFIFHARWGGEPASGLEFAVILFAGLIVFNLFAECINRAPALIPAHSNYVKKIVFPLELLPWVSILSALFHAILSLAALLLFYFVLYSRIHWTAVFLPVLFLPFLFVLMGCSWLLAAVGVFWRDAAHAAGMLTMGMLFLSPVFYPTSAIPEPYRRLLYMNPLTFVIDQVRDVLIGGKLPDWGGWAWYLIPSFLIAWTGFAWFQKARKGFADVL